MSTNDLESLILSKKWHFYVARYFSWFLQYTQILANKTSTLTNYLGFDISQENYLVLNGDEYYTNEEVKKRNQVLSSLAKKDLCFFDKLAKKEFEIVDTIKAYLKKLKSKRWDNLTNEDLAKEIQKFQEIYTLSFVPGFSRPDDYLEVKTKELLRSELKVSEKKLDKIFSIIATYPNLGKLAYTDEPLELLRIARLIKQGSYSLNNLPLKITKKLDKHIELYSWMKGPVLIDDVSFSKEEYLERLNNLLTKDIDMEINRIVQVRKDDQAKYKQLLETYKLSKELKKYVEAVRNFIFLRTYTTEASDSLFYVGRHSLIMEAAKRLNLSLEDIVLLSSDEISVLLRSRVNDDVQNLISERKKGYAIVWLKGKSYTLFGTRAIKLQKLVASKFKGEAFVASSKPKVIKGTPASLGYVKGRVKVLQSYLEVDKVNEGDILVASMTTPDYVMAMEKASGFITDEGGITCHAAIVAREFGVPCVIGTGNATAILKDGDLIEMDAEKGIVRIIRDD